MNSTSNAELVSLVARSQKGDRTAIDTLIFTIQTDVFKLAQRFLMNPDDAKDATQEILLKVITRLSHFEGRSQ